MTTDMPLTDIRLKLPTPDHTIRLAAEFASVANQDMTILLKGKVGTGKTFFARALIQNLLEKHGQIEDVPSPTFTLVQTYLAGELEIWHADLYRLGSTDEVFELGLDAAFGTALCLIEWPEKLGNLAPANAITLSFDDGSQDEARICTVSSADPKARAVIYALAKRMPDDR